MPELDRFAGYVIAAFALTWLVLGGYLLLLRARLEGLRRELERQQGSRRSAD